MEKDLIDFEKDVICGFEKTDGPSLWETVLLSLNEDTRSVVTDSRVSSRRNSRMDSAEPHQKCDTSVNFENNIMTTLPDKLLGKYPPVCVISDY